MYEDTEEINKFFNQLRVLVRDSPIPQSGVIQFMRNLQKVSAFSLSKSMDITAPTFSYLQRQEETRNGKLATLQKVADSLDCDFVYFLIPRDGESPLNTHSLPSKYINRKLSKK